MASRKQVTIAVSAESHRKLSMILLEEAAANNTTAQSFQDKIINLLDNFLSNGKKAPVAKKRDNHTLIMIRLDGKYWQSLRSAAFANDVQPGTLLRGVLEEWLDKEPDRRVVKDEKAI